MRGPTSLVQVRGDKEPGQEGGQELTKALFLVEASPATSGGVIYGLSGTSVPYPTTEAERAK